MCATVRGDKVTAASDVFDREPHPLAVTIRGAGWEHVHVCIDDASRLACVEVLRDEKGLTTVGFSPPGCAERASGCVG